ncbi:hypothetical protein ACA910_010039 [Epithemia clementina (nom. ined.)]
MLVSLEIMEEEEPDRSPVPALANNSAASCDAKKETMRMRMKQPPNCSTADQKKKDKNQVHTRDTGLEVLYGKVRYVYQLQPAPPMTKTKNNNNTSRKRPRSTTSTIKETTTTTTSTSTPASSLAITMDSSDQDVVAQAPPQLADESVWAGWIFGPTTRRRSTTKTWTHPKHDHNDAHGNQSNDSESSSESVGWCFLSVPHSLVPLLNQYCAISQNSANEQQQQQEEKGEDVLVGIHDYQSMQLPIRHLYYFNNGGCGSGVVDASCSPPPPPLGHKLGKNNNNCAVVDPWLTQQQEDVHAATTITKTQRPAAAAPCRILITTLIEVFPNGLSICNNNNNNSHAKIPRSVPDHQHQQQHQQQQARPSTPRFWTLGQLKRLLQMGERPRLLHGSVGGGGGDGAETSHDNNQDEENKKTAKETLYSFQARVKAVTPVLYLRKSTSHNNRHYCAEQKPNPLQDMFCLMELHQYETTGIAADTTTEHVCTVVFRSSYLTVAQSPWVGQRIALHNVSRREWRVPHVVNKHYHKNTNQTSFQQPMVPTRVFVVEQVHQLVVVLPPTLSCSFVPRCNTQTRRTSRLAGTGPPFAVDNNAHDHDDNTVEFVKDGVVEADGTIQVVHWISMSHSAGVNHSSNEPSHERQHLHYIEFSKDPDKQTDRNRQQSCSTPDKYILYLTCYPMDTCLQWSLRKGARIKAVNVHCIGTETKGSNTRQTKNSTSRTLVLAACIRSSILLVQPSCLWTRTASVTVLAAAVQPLWYSRTVTTGYREWNRRRQVKEWLRQSGLWGFSSNNNSDNSNSGSDAAQLERDRDCWGQVQTLSQALFCQQQQEQQQHIDGAQSEKQLRKKQEHQCRNAYVEFFHPADTTEQKGSDESIGHDGGLHDDRGGTMDAKSYCSYCFKESPRNAALPLQQPQEQQQQPHEIDECLLLKSQSLEKSTSPPHPDFRLITLVEIQSCCLTQLQSRLTSYLTTRCSNSVKVGWTASFLLSAEDLCWTEHEPAKCSTIWTGGSAATGETKFGTFITAKGVSFPILPKHCMDCQKESAPPQNGWSVESTMASQDVHHDIAMARVHAVAVSVLCVVAANSNSVMEHSNFHACSDFVDTQVLPPAKVVANTSDDMNRTNANGFCFWASAKNGFKFVASAFLVCNEIKYISNDKKPAKTIDVDSNSDGASSPATSSSCTSLGVLRVLEGNLDAAADQNAHFSGLLIRKFLRPMKARKFSGAMFTLSHFPNIRSMMGGSMHFLQTVDIKTTATLDTACLLELRRRLNEIPRMHGMPDEQLALLHVWILLASSPQSCALLFGGFDELCDSSIHSTKISNELNVRVQVPLLARQVDAQRGYIRFRCELAELSAQIVQIKRDSDPWLHQNHHRGKGQFDFIGGNPFLAGMITSRPLRIGKRPYGRGIGGSLSCLGLIQNDSMEEVEEDGIAIPVVSMGQLMAYLSLDLGSGGRANMAPSLVREIRNAFLLGISYCRVQAECHKCFSPLKCQGAKTGKKDIKQSEASDDAEIPSFWNYPLPLSGQAAMPAPPEKDGTEEQLNSESTARSNNHPEAGESRFHAPRKTSPLRCPNGHDVGVYGAVKWECSGVLDDGTGQAKLYAERDVAVLLLGLGTEQHRQCLYWIEQVAFLNENGVVFSKAMPLNPLLNKAVVQAKDRLRYEQRSQRSRRTVVEESHVLEHMDPILRGQYLLQRHLRLVYPNTTAVRPLRYFVRCKPLSDQASVQQTEVRLWVPANGQRYSSQLKQHINTEDHEPAPTEVVAAAACYRPNFSYSLPPLKLVLVDVAMAFD